MKVEAAMVLAALAESVGQARRAYLRFMAEGKGSGHRADYYDVRDQRFLGDGDFVEQIDERIRAQGEVEVSGPRAKFSELLRLTAEAFDMKERDLVQAGRQRKWIRARSMLVYWRGSGVRRVSRKSGSVCIAIHRLSAGCTQRTRQIATGVEKHC